MSPLLNLLSFFWQRGRHGSQSTSRFVSTSIYAIRWGCGGKKAHTPPPKKGFVTRQCCQQPTVHCILFFLDSATFFPSFSCENADFPFFIVTFVIKKMFLISSNPPLLLLSLCFQYTFLYLWLLLIAFSSSLFLFFYYYFHDLPPPPPLCGQSNLKNNSTFCLRRVQSYLFC